jgi:hypothetical protein
MLRSGNETFSRRYAAPSRLQQEAKAVPHETPSLKLHRAVSQDVRNATTRPLTTRRVRDAR